MRSRLSGSYSTGKYPAEIRSAVLGLALSVVALAGCVGAPASTTAAASPASGAPASGMAATSTAETQTVETQPASDKADTSPSTAKAAAGEAAAAVPSAPVSASGVAGIDHLGLTVTDLEASKALFLDVFGFRVRGADKKYPAYFLTNDHTTITLWRAKDPANATAFNRRQNVGLHHVAFSVASFEALDALHLRLSKYPGVKVEFAPELAYGGPAKHMMFREPSGNRIELVHRPAK